MWITYRDMTQTPPVRHMCALGWGPEVTINCLSGTEYAEKHKQLSADAMKIHLAALCNARN